MQLKIFFIFLFCAALGALPAHAQQRLSLQKAANRLAYYTQQQTMRAVRQAARKSRAWTNRTIRRSVFLIDQSPNFPMRGSGFVVQDPITNTLWGVTARHMQEYLPPDFPVVFADENGKTYSFYAHLAFHGNIQGADIALIRLPPEAAAVARPLKLAKQLPKPGENLFSIGYGKGVLQTINGRTVFTAYPAYITTAFKLPKGKRAGYCGSPVFNAQGEVAGVHCGSSFPLQDAQQPQWHRDLQSLNSPDARWPAFSVAIPGSWVKQLLAKARGQESPGTALKINGVTITQLAPEDAIIEISLIQNGKLTKRLRQNPFIDYAHLEKLFALAPQDELLVIVSRGDAYDPYRKTWRYRFKQSDGTVSRESLR